MLVSDGVDNIFISVECFDRSLEQSLCISLSYSLTYVVAMPFYSASLIETVQVSESILI